MSGKDELVNEIEGLRRRLKGVDTEGKRACEAVGDSLAETADTLDDLVIAVSGVIDRLIEAEARIQVLETAADRRETYEQEQKESG